MIAGICRTRADDPTPYHAIRIPSSSLAALPSATSFWTWLSVMPVPGKEPDHLVGKHPADQIDERDPPLRKDIEHLLLAGKQPRLYLVDSSDRIVDNRAVGRQDQTRSARPDLFEAPQVAA